MNKLPIQKRIHIINCLVEGMSMRATSRLADVSINTVTKLLVDVGRACEKFHNEMVLRVPSKRVQCDEIWSFVYSKEKNVPEGMEDYAGDVWTWTALCADSKLIVSWYVGQRDAIAANDFMNDVASRLLNRVQLTTDGHRAHCFAIALHFVYYNFVKQHKTLRITPAMAAGLTKRFWSIEDLVRLTD
jgi:lambda repressor-like predicted transcriptional regulator